jgi:seryl-tRNA synthetase
MLDIRLIRENAELVKQAIALKNVSADIDAIVALDVRRREVLVRADELKKERNELSGEVGRKLKAKENADALKDRVRELGDEIKKLDGELATIEPDLNNRLLWVPNPPHDSVPHGKDETENRVLREWGTPPELGFTPKPHWEIAESLGIIDFARGAKLTGSGFIVYSGPGAQLQRTLINFMIDMHVTRHGFREIYPPFLVNRQTLTGTGQLPKFEEDTYRVDLDDLFLIPTAEVPVTNLRRDEIIPDQELPLYMVAFTPCFRREAGSHGKENRGITRIHQFDKVEMVKIVRPEDSYAELETLREAAEEVLQALGLHYRLVEICTGDLGFSNAKQYDLEVWAPGMGRFLEVSSCSNTGDYQARRAGIRFRRDAKSKPEFVHTLNGSGLALPRTMIALLETYQQADGTVRVPDALKSMIGRDTL